jgi:hypothetical protein
LPPRPLRFRKMWPVSCRPSARSLGREALDHHEQHQGRRHSCTGSISARRSPRRGSRRRGVDMRKGVLRLSPSRRCWLLRPRRPRVSRSPSSTAGRAMRGTGT